MKQFDALDARYMRLRASHDQLLAAANEAVGAWGGGSQLEIDSAMKQLQAAITAAEELVHDR